MWDRISNWLYKISSGWIALVGLAVFLLFSALVLPGESAQTDLYAGEAGSPDLSFYYSPADLYRMAEAYGVSGREAYIRSRLTFDLVFPLIYTFFLSTSISWLYPRAFAGKRWWQRANILPLLGMLFDYLENFSVLLVMLRYPKLSPGIDAFASVSTMMKWGFIAASFVLLLIGVAAFIWRWFKNRGRS